MQEILSYSVEEGRTKGDYAAMIEAEDLERKVSYEETKVNQNQETM